MKHSVLTEYTYALALEIDAIKAGSAWACMFSSSDEFEQALIAERRAQGRYARNRTMPAAFWTGSALAMASMVFLFV